MVRSDRSQGITERSLASPEIVLFPAEADVTSNSALSEGLVSAFRPGVSLVIVDMSAAEFCDFSAIRALIIANNQAACTGAELRVVICSPAVRRAMELMGADQMLRLYPDISSALAGSP